MADDELAWLQQRWGSAFEITFGHGMYRARRYGTQAAVSAPTAAGLDQLLGEDLIQPFTGNSPVDLRKLRRRLAASTDFD